MSLRISTSIPSLVAQHYMARSSRELERAYSELVTGKKHGPGSLDAAGFAIGENLRGHIGGMRAAKENAGVAASFVQTAEGGLNEQNNILIRMRELAIQAASDTYSDQEREFIELEFSQLGEEFDRIANTTNFGSTQLLMGDSKSYEFQVGTLASSENQIRYTNDTNTTASNIGIEGLTVSDQGDARDALEAIDSGLTQIAQARARFGAVQSRLQSTEDFLSMQIVNIEEARSRIADADVADAVSRAKQNEIIQQYQAQVLSLANQLPALSLKLIA